MVLFLFRSEKRPLRTPGAERFGSDPAVSILKPLKGVDEGLEENLRSFLSLDYPAGFEILFCLHSEFDPAAPVVKRLMEEYPHVPARILISPLSPIPNPKAGNLWKAIHQAHHEVLLISDSNVRVDRNYLSDLVSELEPEVGMVSSIIRGAEPRTFAGALEAVYLNTFYLRGMMLAEWVGKPCVVGKAMLFRKEILERLGGMKLFGRYLAEDYVAGLAVRFLGKKVRISTRPVDQVIGRYCFREFWSRHLRWGRIRRAQAPIAYIFEPFTYPIVLSITGAILGSRLFAGAGFFPIFSALFFAHFYLDAHLQLRFQSEFSPKVAAAWWVRELLAPIQWFAIALGRDVSWRGNRITVRPDGLIRN